MAAQQVERVAVDRGHVGFALHHRVEAGALADEGPQHGAIERVALGCQVRQQMVARRVVAGVRVLGGVGDGAAEGIHERCVRAVGTHDEVRDVGGAPAIAWRRRHRRGQERRWISAQGPGIAAHEHAPHIVARP